MAQAKVMKGTSLLIKVGDGATPTELFAHPCLINTDRGIVFTAETNDSVIPDCDDPELIAWMGREKVSLSAAINGAGTLNTPDTPDYFEWFESENTKNVRVELVGVPLADGGGYFAGAFHLTQFEVTGTRGQKVQTTVGMASDGAVTWTDAAA